MSDLLLYGRQKRTPSANLLSGDMIGRGFRASIKKSPQKTLSHVAFRTVVPVKTVAHVVPAKYGRRTIHNSIHGDMIGRSWFRRAVSAVEHTVDHTVELAKKAAEDAANMAKKAAEDAANRAKQAAVDAANKARAVADAQKMKELAYNASHGGSRVLKKATKAGAQIANVHASVMKKVGVPSAIVNKVKVYQDPTSYFRPSALKEMAKNSVAVLSKQMGTGDLADQTGISAEDLSTMTDVKNTIDNGKASLPEGSDLQQLLAALQNKKDTTTASTDAGVPATVSSTYVPRGRGAATTTLAPTESAGTTNDLSDKYIRNASIRAAAQKLADAYPKFTDLVITIHTLSFHKQDDSGDFKLWKIAAVPLHALTYDLSYWMSQDGCPSTLCQDWWSICDVLAGYLVLSAQSGQTFTAESDYPVAEISRYGIDSTLARAVLTSFSRHVSEIQNGSSLYDLKSVINAVSPAINESSTTAESINPSPLKKSGLGKYAVPLVIGGGLLFLVMRNK